VVRGGCRVFGGGYRVFTVATMTTVSVYDISSSCCSSSTCA